MALTRAACIAARTRSSRASGVAAASAAWPASSWLSGWMTPQVRSPTLMPWTGLRKIVFCFPS